MFSRTTMLLQSACVAIAVGLGLAGAQAQETVKIGLIVPMTGGQASTGKQIDNAVKLYIQQHGDTVAGKKIEVIVKDDATLPDNTKRLAQELIVNDKVNVIAGFGITPAALAAAPLATAGQGAADRDGGRHLDRHRTFALYRAHQLHAGAIRRPSSAIGRRRTASRRWRRSPPTMRPVTTR